MSQDLNLRPAAEIIDDMFAPYRKRIATLEAENAGLRRLIRAAVESADGQGYVRLTKEHFDAAMKENGNG